ncbi:hypothetical protein [Capnocytophaga sp. HP1101]
MKKNFNLRKTMRYLTLGAVASLTLTSCVGYYYADGIYNDPVPERVRYVERESYPERYDYPPENRYSPNKYRDYFGEKAQQYQQKPDSSFTHFTDVNSYRSNAYTSGNSSYGGWGSNPSRVNVNVYNNGWMNPYYGWNNYWGYGAWYPYNYYGYYDYPYYRNRSGWSISLGWGWGNYYDPYWGGYYGGYYPYYGYGYPYGYYGYYGYPYYGYGYYYDYYRPRDYYYEPNRSYGRDYYGRSRGRAIIRDDGRRGDPNRYSNYNNGSYNRSQTQGSNNYGNGSQPNYQNQSRGNEYNGARNGYELRRAYESNNSNYSGRSSNYGNSNSGGNYNSGGSYNSGSSNQGYRSSNRR